MTLPVTERPRGARRLRRRALRLSLALLSASLACAPRDSSGDSANADAAALLAADSVFASDSRVRGAEAWAAAWAEWGRMETGGGGQAVGPEEVRSAVAPMLDELGARFRWTPDQGDLLWPDSLGYTVGRWWIEPPAGGSPPQEGRYLTAWIRESGAWRVALDLSLQPCDANAAGAGDFDFWVGDWTVSQQILQQDGSYAAFSPASDTVSRVDGCVLVESWQGTVHFFWEGMTGPRAIRGASVRVYDADAGGWRIYWIDTLTGAFGAPFVGTFHDGVGEFVAPPLTDDGQERRIRFSREGAAVLWELALRRPDGSWLPLWRMRFERPA